MGLHIGIITAKKLFRPLNGKIFCHINALTAAIIAFARISFRIFVGQRTAHSRHHRFADPVLRRDQLNMAVLPLLLVHDRLGDLGIDLFYLFE